MALPKSIRLETEQIIELLTLAEALIRSDRLAEAAEQYRRLLDEPALDEVPMARTEVFANYGALLLHEARLDPDGALGEHRLDQAIDMLVRAQHGYRLGQGAGSGVTTATNLALAYFQRHRSTGQHADLISAHLALDGAETAADPEDQAMLEWIGSIRQALSARVDRQRQALA
jgi:hypothetical protein